MAPEWAAVLTNTQKHKCTNIQIHKYTNVQIHKYKYMDRWMLIGTVLAPEWALGNILDARTNTS